VSAAPPIRRWVTWTRLQGALLDVAAALLVGLGAGHLLARPRTGAWLGLLVGAASALRWSSMRAARALQRRRPVLGSALEAYLEGQGGTLRPRLEGWVAGRVGPVVLPGGIVRLGLALVLALGVWAFPRPQPAAVATEPPPAPATLSVTARVEPPAYTGWPSVKASLPLVRGLRGSTVHLDVRADGPSVSWSEREGAAQRVMLDGGRASLSFVLDRSRSLRLEAGGQAPVVLIELEAVPDRAPQVTLEAPASDRSVTARPGALSLRASARDDVAVAALDFHWTLAQGRGEGMKFRGGRLSGRASLQGTTAEAEATLDPAAVGMRAGDTLVLWAEATDGNAVDGPGQGRSEARVLTWEEALIDFTGTGTAARLLVPRSQLTERELLARTERLVRSGVRGAARLSRSTELAEDQRRIRESFGFFLQMEKGESVELDVDDPELAESGDAKARRLLAQAVSAMWAAEAELGAGNPAGAIPPERAAVKALEAAFGTERLALRALRPPDKPVDEGRRLTGRQSDLRPRPSPAASEPRADPSAVERVARTLLLAAEQDLGAEGTRALADELWNLPPQPGLPVTALAGPLYATGDAPSRAAAARAAGIALSRWLRPAPVALPPVSPEEGAVLSRVPLPGRR
jgi:Domain of unknown function (DUF4175)